MKFAALLAALVAAALAQQWEFEQVDSAGWGSVLQMRRAPDGSVCLCYCAADGRIRVARKETEWHYEDIDTALGRAGFDGPSFAVGPQGSIGMATMRGMGVDYLHRMDTGWTSEATGFSGRYQGVFPCLSYDTAAIPNITYCYNGYDHAGGILFGTRTDSGWIADTVLWVIPQQPYACLFLTSRLEVDPLGAPHILVENGSGMADKDPPWSYSLCTWAGRNGSWTNRYVAGGGFLEYVDPHDLATDDLGREVACFGFGDSNGDWWFRCESEIVAADGANDAAVRVDTLRRPHLAWILRGALRYAYRTAFWHITDVPTGQSASDCDLLLDTLGEPLIAYTAPDGVWLAHGVDIVGQAEERQRPTANSQQLTASVVRYVLFLPEAPSHKPQAASCLLDVSGRKLIELHPGANDVSKLAPGVYFVQEVQAQAQAQAVRKVVITR